MQFRDDHNSHSMYMLNEIMVLSDFTFSVQHNEHARSATMTS
jgi:hypothetical protein